MLFIGRHQHERIQLGIVEQLLRRAIATRDLMAIRHVVTAFCAGIGDGRQGHVR
jgi:hypothetical protein